MSLQNNLKAIERFGEQWEIKFSPTKTFSQTFTKNKHHVPSSLNVSGQLITKISTHKHLGLTLSEDLIFQPHINSVIKKVNIALSPLYLIAKFLSRDVLYKIFKTYIRPYFDYCDCIYDGHLTISDELRLERLQNRAARLVTNALPRTSIKQLRLELGWDGLKTRRKTHRLFLYEQIKNDPNIPDYIRNTIPETTRRQRTNT